MQSIIASELYFVEGLLVSFLLRLVRNKSVQLQLIEEFLYKNCFGIEPDLMTSWIASTLDTNELRSHDDVIKRYIKLLANDQKDSEAFYVDITNNEMKDGYKHEIIQQHAFLMERKLVTLINTFWKKNYNTQFKGSLSFNKNDEEVHKV